MDIPHSKGRLLAVLANIRPGLKGVSVKNAPDYYRFFSEGRLKVVSPNIRLER